MGSLKMDLARLFESTLSYSRDDAPIDAIPAVPLADANRKHAGVSTGRSRSDGLTLLPYFATMVRIGVGLWVFWSFRQSLS